MLDPEQKGHMIVPIWQIVPNYGARCKQVCVPCRPLSSLWWVKVIAEQALSSQLSICCK